MKNFFYLLLLALFAGCNEENPFVSKEVIDEIERQKKPEVSHIAIISDNNVYYLENIESDAKQLTHTTSIKTNVRISHGGGKIAYIDHNLNPVIIDTAGNVLNTLIAFDNVSHVDWSNDDETLYMLIGNELKFYGPALSVPSLTPSDESGYDIEVTAVSISQNDELAYAYTYFTYNSGWVSKVVVENDEFSKVLDTSYTGHITYVQYVAGTNDLIIGYSDNRGERELRRFEVYAEGANYPYEDFESSERYVDPIYRKDLNYTVCGYKGIGSDKFFLTAKRFMSGEDDYFFAQFNSEPSPLYVNWKQ